MFSNTPKSPLKEVNFRPLPVDILKLYQKKSKLTPISKTGKIQQLNPFYESQVFENDEYKIEDINTYSFA